MCTQSANIGLSKGRQVRGKLLDYGLAKAVEGQAGGTLGLGTVTGGIQGTPAYMAEEALRGRAGVQSDLYSFGVVLLELMSGRAATTDTARQVEDATDDGRNPKGLAPMLDPAISEQISAETSGALLSLLSACLRRRHELRPRGMREVLGRLVQLQQAADPPAALGGDGGLAGLADKIKEVEEQIRQLVAQRDAMREELEREEDNHDRCCICFCEAHVTRGLRCQLDAGIGHFLCDDCLQGYAASEASPDRLINNRGLVVCPGRPCRSQPWDPQLLLPRLQPDTQAQLVAGLQHMLRVQQEAMEAERRLAEERRRAQEEAQRLQDVRDRVERYRRAVVEDYLTLKCPRCQAAFLDYDGCDALRCNTCFAGFCALCLAGT